MEPILLQLARALRMAETLSWFSSFPIYVIAYGLAVWVVIRVVRAAVSAWRYIRGERR